jgi:hypothetical protein
MARLVDLAADNLLIARDLDFEVFADVDGSDALIAHLAQRVLDGFALGIEDGLFRRDDYLCFHLVQTDGPQNKHDFAATRKRTLEDFFSMEMIAERKKSVNDMRMRPDRGICRIGNGS